MNTLLFGKSAIWENFIGLTLLGLLSQLMTETESFHTHHFQTSYLHLSHKQKVLFKVTPLKMSFVADGSDYSSSDSDYEDASSESDDNDLDGPGFNPLAMNAPTIEEVPIPTSKNAGSRFIAFIWDHLVDVTQKRSRIELHDSRVKLTTDHVMHCRKTNLYNETFNYNSAADVIWSYPL